MKQKNNKVAVVVTTNKDRRGVFFGYINPEEVKFDLLRVEEVQMCLYWTETRGVLGLASEGPNSKCRVSRAAPSIILDGVTAIIEASEEAVKNWKKMPWSA